MDDEYRIKEWLRHAATEADEKQRAYFTEALALIERLGKMADDLLNHCPISECDECSRIACPHDDDSHFHHDGCPSCCSADGTLACQAV